MATKTSPSFSQRVRRFLDEDAATFALTSALGVAAFLTREFRSAPMTTSTARRLQLAARRTLPMLPIVMVSSAVGIVGIKLTLSAVQDVRRDYSRTSLLIAVPVFAALMHAPGGPRLMAKSAIGYGGFILAADYAAFHYHQHKLLKLEQQMLEEAYDLDALHHHDHHHGHLHDSDVFVRRGAFPDAQHLATFSPERSVMLVQK